MTTQSHSFFQDKIFQFQFENSSLKPWQISSEPYNIWLFEIIMQQTRMQQGIPYYERIIEKYPTLTSLAVASEEELFSLWKGLGYYSRARNLHFTAKYIFNDLKGKFPKTYTELLKLKGVGEYTAAAIASFSYGENVAVLDGNVYRILSRYFGIAHGMVSSQEKKVYSYLANSLLIKGKSALFNQAIMDLGSQICTPQNPNCNFCLLNTNCVAFNTSKIEYFPPKKPKLILKDRFFHQVFVISNQKVYLNRRTENDIWKGLFQGYLEETKEFNIEKFHAFFNLNFSQIKFTDWNIQKLSHQKIHMKHSIVYIKEKIDTTNWFETKLLENIPFPRISSKWYEENKDKFFNN